MKEMEMNVTLKSYLLKLDLVLVDIGDGLKICFPLGVRLLADAVDVTAGIEKLPGSVRLLPQQFVHVSFRLCLYINFFL